MKISYIGNFKKLWDEEYIAQAFEELGHEVQRIPEMSKGIPQQVEEFNPDFVIWAKLGIHQADRFVDWCREKGYKTVCWVFDLYWGYAREYQIESNPMFKADIVISTDGGNADKWEQAGIKHYCVRQGIHAPECYLEDGEIENNVLFVGSYNRYNTERNEILEQINKDFDLKWVGKVNTDECRGPKLNRLYGKTKVVVGDSVFSPFYWSNRVVETLGRGGFLIHVDVPGIKEEYPHLVTYERGNYRDLKEKIGHYIQNPNQREELRNKNYEWVKNNYTCKHKCQEVIDIVCQNQ